MTHEMDRFREAFFEEAAEHVAILESGLLELEGSPRNSDLLNTIFRAAHSIKGASGTFGLDEVTRFTHSLENLLDRMRAGTLDSTPERLDLLLRSSDLLRGLLVSARAGQTPPPAMEEILAQLKMALGEEPKVIALDTAPNDRPSKVSPQGYRITFVPDRDFLRQGMDPYFVLRDLTQAGDNVVVRADTSRLPPASEFEPETCYLAWSIQLRTDHTAAELREVVAHVEDISQVTIESLADEPPVAVHCQASSKTSASRFCESLEVSAVVPLTKADDLLHLAIDLVRAQATLMRTAGDFTACLHSH